MSSSSKTAAGSRSSSIGTKSTNGLSPSLPTGVSKEETCSLKLNNLRKLSMGRPKASAISGKLGSRPNC